MCATDKTSQKHAVLPLCRWTVLYKVHERGEKEETYQKKGREGWDCREAEYFVRMCVCACGGMTGWQGDRDHRPSAVDGIWDSLVTSTDIQKHMYRWLPLRVCEELCPVLSMQDSKYTLIYSVCHVQACTHICQWCTCDFWRTHQNHMVLLFELFYFI